MVVNGCLACRICTIEISVLELTASRCWRFRNGGTEWPGVAGPSDAAEAPDVLAHHYDTLPAQEGTLQGDIATVTPDQTAGGDDSVAGHQGIGARGHDVANRPPPPGLTRQCRDVPVRGHPAWRDSPDGGPHACGERRTRHVCSLTGSCARSDHTQCSDCPLTEPQSPESAVRRHISGGAPRLATLLGAQMLPVFSHFAPCDPGAAHRIFFTEFLIRATSTGIVRAHSAATRRGRA